MEIFMKKSFEDFDMSLSIPNITSNKMISIKIYTQIINLVLMCMTKIIPKNKKGKWSQSFLSYMHCPVDCKIFNKFIVKLLIMSKIINLSKKLRKNIVNIR